MWKNAMKFNEENINGVRRFKSKNLLMEINIVDEDKNVFYNYWKHILILYAQTNIGILFEMGK